MHRQIVLDTETTGIRVEDGHRVIEIGCIEMIDRKLTGNHFHYYLNPERDIEAGAVAVHGLTVEFLQDKPLFSHIAKDFIEFIQNAELIIHNAPFDVAFLDYELNQLTSFKKILDYCRVIDTLQMARKIHVGQRNSLDALCKRYHVDNSKRDYHGALLDAHLLAQVYLAMTGGQGSFFESLHDGQSLSIHQHADKVEVLNRKFNLVILQANEEELLAHQQYLESMQKINKCLWLEEKVEA